MAALLTPIATKALTFTGIQFIVALTGTLFATYGRKLSKIDKFAAFWYIYDFVVHATLESAFLYYSLTKTVAKSEGFLAEIWQEYGRADVRWAQFDSTIVSLELLTVLFCSPICLLVVYGIVTNKPWRHFWQIVVNVCELYGGWMTFGPEWITGSKGLNTSNPLYLWVYLFFFNMLWVVMPLIFLYQSYNAIYQRKERSVKKQQ